MSNFNRNDRSGGGRRSGGSRARRGEGDFPRRSSRREMHQAICSNCGNKCEVPFKPTGDKPVYCSDCFEKRGGGSSNRPGRRDSRRPRFEQRDNTNNKLVEQVNSLSTKLDRILNLLESKEQKKEKVETKKIEEEEVKKKVKKETKIKKKEVKKVAKKTKSKKKILKEKNK